jgi:ABC-type transporter Mla maintaining outer membrane lipid asymmetry ATPase subunit MlaF
MPGEIHKNQTTVMELIDVDISDLKDPRRVVLERVNWRVERGDYWVVGGLHASGKSNLIATLAGIMPPLSGEYRLFEESLSSQAQLDRFTARQRLGIVFDGGRLIHDLTIAENIALPLRYHGNLRLEEVTSELEVLLEALGLEPFATSHPATVGRNWQQRTGLARALALKPEILLLDNALTGLDPRDAAWWLSFLGTLSSGHPLMGGKPVTLIGTADDLRPWRDRGSRFALLKGRQFVVVGSQEELRGYRDPLLNELLAGYSKPS